MEEIDKILLNMIGSRSNQNQYHLFKLRASWPEIAGKNNARHCIPAKLDRRILTLQADSSAWANQFLYYKLQLIEKINSFMGVDYVKDIKFITGKSVKKNVKRTDSGSRPEKSTVWLPPLTKEEKEAVALKFSHIKNENIRNAVIQAEEKKFALEKLFIEGKIKKCRLCGAYIKDGTSICFACERKKQEEKETEIWKWIVKEPWIRWSEIQKAVNCDQIQFDIIKNDVKAFYFEKIRNKTADEKEVKIAVQLKAGKPYALIPEKERENIVKFLQKGKM